MNDYRLEFSSKNAEALKVAERAVERWIKLEEDSFEILDYRNPISSEVSWFANDFDWYERELVCLSKSNLDVLFTVTCHNEEYNEHWKKYIQDGKVQTSWGWIEYDPFDPAKLRPYVDVAY